MIIFDISWFLFFITLFLKCIIPIVAIRVVKLLCYFEVYYPFGSMIYCLSMKPWLILSRLLGHTVWGDFDDVIQSSRVRVREATDEFLKFISVQVFHSPPQHKGLIMFKCSYETKMTTLITPVFHHKIITCNIQIDFT